MSKSAAFVVYGSYSHEQSRHVVSRHRKAESAWRAAHRAHFALGGCAGGNMLATVLRRLEGDALRRYQEAVILMDYYRRVAADVSATECVTIDGVIYAPADYWVAHRVQLAAGGFVSTVK